MKKYIECVVINKDEKAFMNPLKISEAYVIAALLRSNIEVRAKIMECSPERYKQLFGK